MIREQGEARTAKPPAAKGASPLPSAGIAPTPGATGTVPGPAPASSPFPQYDSLPGVWQGAAFLPDYGNCNLKLELRPAPEPGQFTGLPVLLCVSGPPFGGGAKSLAQFNPSSAVITGRPNDKSVEFSVDEVISKGGGRQCSFISFAVTRFRNDQIAAEWKEDNCPAGQMLLRRTGK